MKQFHFVHSALFVLSIQRKKNAKNLVFSWAGFFFTVGGSVYKNLLSVHGMIEQVSKNTKDAES